MGEELESARDDAGGEIETGGDAVDVRWGSGGLDCGVMRGWDEDVSGELVGPLFLRFFAVVFAVVDEAFLFAVVEDVGGLVEEGEPELVLRLTAQAGFLH